MRFRLFYILSVLLLFSCEKNTQLPEDLLPKGINISTDKDSYLISDSITITVENYSENKIILEYRCNFKNLEMYYQKKEDDKWSEDKWFNYMYLKCMTIQGKLKAHAIVKNKISAREFKVTGTFRLFVPYYISEKDSNAIGISNSFEIK